MEDSTPHRGDCRGAVAVRSGATSAVSCCLPSSCFCPSSPGYGYGLEPRLQEFRFGHVDRPGGLPGPGPAGTGWPGGGRRRRTHSRAGPARLPGDRPGRAGVAGVDGRHQGGARLPRARYCADIRPPGRPTPCWPRSRGVGDGAGFRLVAGIVDLAWPAPHLALVDEDVRTAAPDQARSLDVLEPSGGDGFARSFRWSPTGRSVMIEVRSTVGPLSFGAIGDHRIDRGRRHRRGRYEPNRPLQPASKIDVSKLTSGNSCTTPSCCGG